jgi:hypothetical protein
MREGILPTWEDKKNKGGNIISIQIPEKIINGAWTLLAALVVGEIFIEKNYLINGISIKYVDSSKTNNIRRKTITKRAPTALIKIWIGTKTIDTSISSGVNLFVNKLIPKYVDKTFKDYQYSIQTSKIKAEY